MKPAKTKSADAVNLYLVGFMATGKSSAGRQISRKLGLRFVDVDHAIERQEGRRIAEIFAAEGEAHFRRLERAFIEGGHPATGMVVSCGGGLVVQPGMLDLLHARGVVISLFARPETIIERTRGRTHRPLLEVDDPEERIRQLLAERESVYMEAGPGVCTDNRAMGEVADHIIRIYQQHARKFREAQKAPRA